MRWKIPVEVLSDSQRIAVYSVLYSAAFADLQVHHSEIEVIESSLGDIKLESPPIRQGIRAVFHNNLSISEIVDPIRTSTGDLAALVYLMVLDVLVADEIIVISEAEFARGLFEALDVASMPSHSRKVIASRLKNTGSLIEKPEIATSDIIHNLIDALRVIDDVGGSSNRSPVPQIILGDPRLETFLNGLKEQKRRARNQRLFNDLA